MSLFGSLWRERYTGSDLMLCLATERRLTPYLPQLKRLPQFKRSSAHTSSFQTLLLPRIGRCGHATQQGPAVSSLRTRVSAQQCFLACRGCSICCCPCHLSLLIHHSHQVGHLRNSRSIQLSQALLLPFPSLCSPFQKVMLLNNFLFFKCSVEC